MSAREFGSGNRRTTDQLLEGVGDLATRVLPRVREDVTGGARSGVNGTPTFFINGQRDDGPHDAVSIIAAIRTALVLTPPPGRVHHR